MTVNTSQIFVTGATGGGKTTILEAILAKSKSVIAITTKQEDFDAPLYVQCRTVEEVVQAIAKTWPHFRICLRIECEPEDTAGACQMAEDMLKAIYHLRRGKFGNFKDDAVQMTIAVDEAHRTFPQHPPIKLKHMNWMITEGRASGLNVIVASQFPTLIPTIIRNNIATWYVLYCGDNAMQSIKSNFSNHQNVKKFQYTLYHESEKIGTGDTRKPQIIQQPA